VARHEERLKELSVFECPKCHGNRQEITDSFVANQLGMPVGFSEKAAARQKTYAKQAHGPCSRCRGKGFILIPKSELDDGK